MHKYFRQIGDYAKDTRHLTLLEHGAYTIMLDIAYASEKPLTKDVSALARLCCAKSKEEKEAVERVLKEFFHEVENGWEQKRVKKELADYRDQSDSARYSNFCKAWKKKNGKNAKVIDLERWKGALPDYLGCHPVVDGEPFDYRTMTEWYSINIPTSNQEPVTSNQEPVFPPDYPAGHVAALSRWWSYKREKRETYKPTGWDTLLKQQAVFTAEQVQRSVEASIGSNYAGLFTDKIAASDLRNPQPQKKEGGAVFVEVDAPARFGEAWAELYGGEQPPWATLGNGEKAEVRRWIQQNR